MIDLWVLICAWLQVYTALVYGGVGTIGRIKNEMREEMAKVEKERRREARRVKRGRKEKGKGGVMEVS